MSNELPFDLVSLSADDVQALEDTYKALQKKFSISLSDDKGIHIKQFELLNTNQDVVVGGSLLINTPTNNCHLVFLKIHYSIVSGRAYQRHEYYKYQAWAFITSKTDFGRILIRHETFNDRVVSLLHHCELEFKDDKPFDHKFYVVTNYDQKALLAMNWNFRNAVMDMGDEMLMETFDHTIIIGNNMPVDAEQIVHLTEFAVKIAALK